MTITTRRYTMPAGGLGRIIDASLSFVRVLRVEREGLGYNQCNPILLPSDVAGNREFVHDAFVGGIYFEDAAIALSDNQNVFIIYKS